MSLLIPTQREHYCYEFMLFEISALVEKSSKEKCR